MYRLMTAAGVAATLLATTALAQDTAPEVAPAEAGAEPTYADSYDAGTVLATVDGSEITLGHVIAMRERLPEQYQSIPDGALLAGILDQLIDQALLAAESGDDVPLEVRLHLDNERRAALAALALREGAAAPLDDAAVQAAYDEAFADFEASEFNAAHILVETEAEAQAVKEEIAGGADFAAVAAEKSKDPGSRENGGSLGWFGVGQMVPEFETAVQGLEVGEVSDPVQSQFGWHVIRLDDTRESAPPPLEQVRPEIENRLRQEALQARVAELREASDVEKTEPGVPPAAIREDDLIRD